MEGIEIFFKDKRIRSSIIQFLLDATELWLTTKMIPDCITSPDDERISFHCRKFVFDNKNYKGATNKESNVHALDGMVRAALMIRRACYKYVAVVAKKHKKERQTFGRNRKI